MPQPDDLGGVLDIIDTEHPELHTTEAPQKTETVTETKTETKTKDDPEVAPPDDDGQDTQDFNRPTDTEVEDETPTGKSEPSKTDTETNKETETNTNTENSEETATADENAPAFDPEPTFQLKAPEYDENGYITNMTPQEYENYVVARAQFNFRHEAWLSGNENKALDAAEKILPQLKTSPSVRQLVEDARVASILNGKQINSYEAAKIVKDALGLSSKEIDTKVAQAKAEGAQNAKASIKIQKNAAVETGSTQKKSEPDNKARQLAKRLKAGEDEAFAELFDQWEENGKL